MSQCALRRPHVSCTTPSPKLRAGRVALTQPHRRVAAVGLNRRSRLNFVCKSSGLSKVAIEIAEGKRLYDDELRQRALTTFEKAVKMDPTKEELQMLYYNICCCYAAFGDFETAQQYLRSGLYAGLDYEKALTDPQTINMEVAPQVRIQLKKFAGLITTSINKDKAKSAASPRSAFPSPPQFQEEEEVNPMMQIEGKDELDVSVVGIIKRVGTVVLVSIVAFTVVFLAGLQLLQVS
mmetsp:Transcript_38894/g.47096  ORF Transcript_38894/g.47096 Transcript_38894/m.47096 type:complete len:236 (-) Transcript_38894:129-836(-)|eukprot:CAMPEP_0197861542 /NCGR_PEP_ID=MMETSP1438-20131217/37687_1 /TAXON_ID=1461541 /ORGANISM="Pterosperma sp., Strain CCMP1384" /LENGTH=235 /DNA_ID=CAMNT_0043478753 /DNA_START=80 /DNA_END=787 /DNA_ORIENTATION=-